MNLDRRGFLKSSTMGLMAFQLGGSQVLLTPREARAKQVPFQVLRPDEVGALEALGDVLLPGAREAGIAHFVDHQLAAEPADCLLLIRYLDVPPPYISVYRPALAALNAASEAVHDAPFTELGAEDAAALVGVMGQQNPEGWSGPPAPMFYFVARSDAIDVVYGTEEGFERLDIPYMAHIRPIEKW